MVQYSMELDRAFAAVADPTRRGILRRLGRGDATISELAGDFAMSLTGIKKHVSVLEAAQLVSTRKVGRVRHCRAGPRRLEQAADWIDDYRRTVNERLDHLERFLERTKGRTP